MQRILVVWAVLLLAACGSETAKLADGAFCTDSAECQSGLCAANACSSGEGPSTSCYSSLQCSGGKLCIGGYCQTPATCTTTEDCAGLLVCSKGKCMPSGEEDISLPDVSVEDESTPPADAADQIDVANDVIQDTGPDIPVEPPCDSDGDCNDANSCTQDLCQNTKCVHTLNAAAGCCSVKEDCTGGTACETPKCSQFNCFYIKKADCCLTDLECDDSQSSTKDRCENNKCAYEQLKTCTSIADCDDGNPCSVESCASNVCSYAPSPDPLCCKSNDDCEDGVASTEDLCLNYSCFFKPEGTCLYDSECDDNNPCTTDTCASSACINVPTASADCLCVKNSDCSGKGEACAPVTLSPGIGLLACDNAVGPKAGGEMCAQDGECKTGVCLSTASGKMCFGGCSTNGQCSAGAICGQTQVPLDGGGNIVVAGCVPAPKSCNSDADCPPEAFCGITTGDNPYTLKTVCQVAGAGTKTTGQECTSNSECRSGTCYLMWETNKKVCWGACTQDSQCPSGMKCYPNTLEQVFDQGTPLKTDDKWYDMPACQPDKGTFTSCLADGDCPKDGNGKLLEFCYPYTNQTRTTLDRRCIKKVGSVQGGGPCAGDVQCLSGMCLGSTTKYCFGLCGGGDCYFTSQCKAVPSYIVNDFGDTDPNNDLVTTVSVCIPNGGS